MKKRKRYARAKPIKKESEEIIKRDRLKALLIYVICLIIIIILCLIIGRKYL